jgi:hypothetical protein
LILPEICNFADEVAIQCFKLYVGNDEWFTVSKQVSNDRILNLVMVTEEVLHFGFEDVEAWLGDKVSQDLTRGIVEWGVYFEEAFWILCNESFLHC